MVIVGSYLFAVFISSTLTFLSHIMTRSIMISSTQKCHVINVTNPYLVISIIFFITNLLVGGCASLLSICPSFLVDCFLFCFIL